MKLKKRYLFPILTFLIAFFACIALIITVNFSMVKDIYTQAEQEIGTFFDFYNDIETDGITYDEYYSESNIIVTVTSFAFGEATSYYSYEKKLIKYINSNNIRKNTVYSIDIDGDKIFFGISTPNNIDGKYTKLIYVNTTEYLYILKKLNKIFLIVSFIILILSLFFGYKVGIALENSENKLKRFFANASHELKTPLTSIQGYAESIYLDISPDIKQNSKIVLEQSELMEKLIEELLLLSKLDSKAIKLELIPLNVYETLDRLVSYIKPVADKNNLDIICDLNGDKATAKCDEKYLYNSLNAILSNAVRFAKEKIIITALASNKQITITIKDDGQGINDKDLPHIFDRFYIGKNGGTGIGLSLAKEILILHGGKIYACNKNGAKFTIVLPLCK